MRLFGKDIEGKLLLGKGKKDIQTFGVIYFIVILVIAHFVWKYMVLGDENDVQVTFLGLDISAPFVFMAQHIAEVSCKLLNMIGYDTILSSGNVICHPGSRNGVCVVWSCTGIKQGYIFFCIIAFYKGPWRHKLWYIPLGLLCIYLFNIFRIVFIIAIINNHPERFDLWHEHITKYLFYILIFGLWVFWNEKFCLPKKKVETTN